MRNFWYIVGILSLGIGIIGVVLPVFPTVPFLLVAVWAFARSSPRLRARILAHPLYGPPIRAWQERGAISNVAKFCAIAAMSAGILAGLILSLPLWALTIQIAVCAMVGIYVLTRPAH